MDHKDIPPLSSYIFLCGLYINFRRQTPLASAFEVPAGENDRLAAPRPGLERHFYIQNVDSHITEAARVLLGRS
jgi:hypothetical protein